MKYYQIKLFSFTLLLMAVAVSGYASRWQKAEKCADKKVQKKYYVLAADKYERLLRCKRLPADSAYTIHAKLGDCYMKMGNTIQAESHYAGAVKSGKADAVTGFKYARSLQANGKYADARDWFDRVAADPSVKDWQPKAFAEKCDKAFKTPSPANKYDITRERFNTSASEYAPAYYKKGLAYTSNASERFVAAHRTMWNKERFTDVYTVQEDNKGDLLVTDKLPAPLNSRLNDGAVCFNAAYDEVFITRNNRHCKRHDQLQVLVSHFNGTEWSRPKVLSFEMPGASYAHPNLSPDGSTLYFSSDVQGTGYGGMDLYMVHRNGNAWETPANLGPLVNTPGNETFPYMAADSSLYFTSDGQPGYGGMDLFHAKFKEGKLSKADNMGLDFNSPKDDLSLIVDTRNRTGYFASNRDGDDDIYSFKLPRKGEDRMADKDKEHINDKVTSDNMRTGKIVDKSTNAPIAGARIEISRPSNPMDGVFYYTNDSGLFHFARKIDADDQVRVLKDKYKVNSFNGASVADARSFEISMDSEVLLSSARMNFTTLYYDINKSNVTDGMMDMLRPIIDRMKGSAPGLVYISGYADEQGGDTYNYGLSLRRVKEVSDYLTSQGIDNQKIKSNYFGAVKLSDKCRQNPKCIHDTDRENRRVEIYIANQ
jgi:outer membrane protein OmpA-like peptidoglycan-associated protein